MIKNNKMAAPNPLYDQKNERNAFTLQSLAKLMLWMISQQPVHLRRQLHGAIRRIFTMPVVWLIIHFIQDYMEWIYTNSARFRPLCIMVPKTIQFLDGSTRYFLVPIIYNPFDNIKVYRIGMYSFVDLARLHEIVFDPDYVFAVCTTNGIRSNLSLLHAITIVKDAFLDND